MNLIVNESSDLQSHLQKLQDLLALVWWRSKLPLCLMRKATSSTKAGCVRRFCKSFRYSKHLLYEKIQNYPEFSRWKKLPVLFAWHNVATQNMRIQADFIKCSNCWGAGRAIKNSPVVFLYFVLKGESLAEIHHRDRPSKKSWCFLVLCDVSGDSESH